MPDAFHLVAMQYSDWPAVREIYREGIATGNATFETEPPSWEEWDAGHLAIGRLVARTDSEVVGWAALKAVSKRACYAGVAEASVYVSGGYRSRGIGRALLMHLTALSEAAGIWTLQAGTFPENEASLGLQTSCGFRVVGRRERIGKLNGVWRDTIVTERRSRRVGTDDDR